LVLGSGEEAGGFVCEFLLNVKWIFDRHRLWHSVLATFISIMPSTLMYLNLGAAGKAAIGGEGHSGDPVMQWSLFRAGLITTIKATLLVTRKAQAKLDQKSEWLRS
jgi:uncharacterized membrane protein YdjX (TVP38/TMEM64 family)